MGENELLIKEIQEKLPLNDEVNMLADFYRVLGDATRVKILSALLHTKELCVFDISEITEMTQSSISHQLRVLRSYNLVKYRRVGKFAYYFLSDEHIRVLIEYGLDHIKE